MDRIKFLPPPSCRLGSRSPVGRATTGPYRRVETAAARKQRLLELLRPDYTQARANEQRGKYPPAPGPNYR